MLWQIIWSKENGQILGLMRFPYGKDFSMKGMQELGIRRVMEEALDKGSEISNTKEKFE